AHVAHEGFGYIALPCCADDSGNSAHGRLLSFHTDWAQVELLNGYRQIGDPFKAIVAIVSWIPFPALASSENDICHLARRHKMQGFVPLRCAAHHFGQELAKGIANDGISLLRVHAMAVEFDEQLVRAYMNGYAR